MKLPYVYRSACLYLLLAALTAQQAQGQVFAEAVLQADSTAAGIGQPLGGTLTVTHSPGLRIQWAPLPDSLGQFEVLRQGRPDTLSASALVVERLVFQVIALDSGRLRLGPVEVAAVSAEGPQLIRSNAVQVQIRLEPVAAGAELRDIRGIAAVPLTLGEIISLALLAVLLAAGLYLLWRRLRRRPAPPEAPPAAPAAVPARPPLSLALEQLDALERASPWLSGQYKEYMTELSGILRIFIQDTAAVPALELTSGELLERLQARQRPEALHLLAPLLELADLVKFAKSVPDADACAGALRQARAYLHAAAPAAETASPA
ncbi:MAG: hypothetical protein NW241_21615 [Bacteroidia bacterium]|nr:hypothetical protein [Bacteroidia bacterium]